MSLITVLIIKNSIVFRKYTQRCSGVKGHHVCNLLSNGFTNNNSNMDTDREWQQHTVKCEHLGICRKSMQGCFALHFPNFPRSLKLFKNLKIVSLFFFFFEAENCGKHKAEPSQSQTGDLPLPLSFPGRRGTSTTDPGRGRWTSLTEVIYLELRTWDRICIVCKRPQPFNWKEIMRLLLGPTADEGRPHLWCGSAAHRRCPEKEVTRRILATGTSPQSPPKTQEPFQNLHCERCQTHTKIKYKQLPHARHPESIIIIIRTHLLHLSLFCCSSFLKQIWHFSPLKYKNLLKKWTKIFSLWGQGVNIVNVKGTYIPK